MHNLVKRLEKRGWSQREIGKAVGIIQNARQNKTKENLFLQKRVYWVLLVIIATANFAIVISIVPLLLVLRGFGLYAIIGVIGIAFGFLLEIVIRGIDHLEKKHHAALAVIIPATAVISAFLITGFSNGISRAFQIENFHAPLNVALVYAASFALPYIIYRFVLKKGYYME